jgi:L-Ala-D/L-Glu epimerase
MMISEIRTGVVSIPLRKPFKTALRTLEHLRSLVITIGTDTGTIGWGEAPPTIAVTGDSLGSVRSAIHEYIAPRLRGKRVDQLEDTLTTLETSCVHNTTAKAAIDMALYDLFGKRFGIPLYRLFGGLRNRVETDLTISVNSPAEMARDSAEAIGRGFRVLKLKVGRDPSLDIARIKAVREAVGPEVVIRLDANQGWTAREAIRIMRAIEQADLGIELVEQPVPAEDFSGLAEVRAAIATPVMADESVFSGLDAERLLTMKAADFLNIKLMKTGGFRGALRICAVAEQHRIECFMGCMMESKLAVTAAAHLACARSIITRCDLDSASLCAEDPVRGGVAIDGPWLTVPETPGLGIDDVEGVVWD